MASKLFTRTGQPKETDMVRSTHENAIHHTQKLKKRLEDTMQHLREEIDKVDEPQLKAMYETSAEVLGGLVNAFQHYERKS
jgi:mevalonate kinase